ncbi:MAG: NUDIX domain-containing protein [Candidatus Berkelbacteria bacterium]|nr:NUDIX domain-containing protein [Candidatus Berkelbacteria bacterium]
MTEKAKFELSAGGLVFKKRNDQIKLLLIKSHGRWALPKGVVGREKKESVINAAKREIYEETGLKKIEYKDKIGDISYMYRLKGKLIFKKVYFFIFEAKSQEEIAPQENEIEEVGWFDTDKTVEKVGFKNTLGIIKKGIKLIKKYG